MLSALEDSISWQDDLLSIKNGNYLAMAALREQVEQWRRSRLAKYGMGTIGLYRIVAYLELGQVLIGICSPQTLDEYRKCIA